MRNLPLTFDCMYCSQKLGEDFAKFLGLLRLYELYEKFIFGFKEKSLPNNLKSCFHTESKNYDFYLNNTTIPKVEMTSNYL